MVGEEDVPVGLHAAADVPDHVGLPPRPEHVVGLHPDGPVGVLRPHLWPQVVGDVLQSAQPLGGRGGGAAKVLKKAPEDF